MRRRGLGLRALCREVGLDPSFFSKVLAGKRSPPAEEGDLRKLAAALGVDAPRLIVSAGRIPEEWRRLWDDEALFRDIHRKVTERYREEMPPSPARGEQRAPARTALPEAPPPRAAGNWETGRTRRRQQIESPAGPFGEELL
ncbi:MAG: helix-turn-helix transcriptional regulator [Elusimicrobia bacterium]|nr:helix-turn-helix transcriptional regulator [Elusimicrobiota bacterium]